MKEKCDTNVDLSWIDEITLECGISVRELGGGIHIRDAGCDCCSRTYLNGASAEELSDEGRRRIADRMIALWRVFGGPKPKRHHWNLIGKHVRLLEEVTGFQKGTEMVVASEPIWNTEDGFILKPIDPKHTGKLRRAAVQTLRKTFELIA
jgi:hypothetical protein